MCPEDRTQVERCFEDCCHRLLSMSANLCDWSKVWAHWSSCSSFPPPQSYPHLNSEAFEALICVCLWRPRPPKTASGLEYFLWAVFSPTLNSLPGIFQTWEVRAPVQRGQALSQAHMTGVFLFRCCCLSKWQGWAQGSPRPSALATWCSWLWPISQT